MTKVQEAFDLISGMTVLEARDLVKKIEEEFGVSAAAPMAMMAAPSAEAEPEEEAPAEEAEEEAAEEPAAEEEAPAEEAPAGPSELDVLLEIRDALKK